MNFIKDEPKYYSCYKWDGNIYIFCFLFFLIENDDITLQIYLWPCSLFFFPCVFLCTPNTLNSQNTAPCSILVITSSLVYSHLDCHITFDAVTSLNPSVIFGRQIKTNIISSFTSWVKEKRKEY